MASVLSSLRYLLADIIGDDDDEPPSLPEGLPEDLAPLVSASIDALIDYQGPSYAQLYVDRLRRFTVRPVLDAAAIGEIARLMAARMSYEDPIRIAQLKLAEADHCGSAPRPPATSDSRKFRVDELIGALPAVVAAPVLDPLEWMGWDRAPVTISFSDAGRWRVRRLKIEAALKRWRLHSIRYAKERVWVERWLHMIDRALTKQPAAAPAIIATAAMISGYGDNYRQGLADWHAIIDGLVKPTFDGELPLTDLAAAITEARAAAMPDPRQAALKRCIAEVRVRAQDSAASVAAG